MQASSTLHSILHAYFDPSQSSLPCLLRGGYARLTGVLPHLLYCRACAYSGPLRENVLYLSLAPFRVLLRSPCLLRLALSLSRPQCFFLPGCNKQCPSCPPSARKKEDKQERETQKE
eukprot:8066265-Pyramimonas_sp.AAC.1